MRRCLVWPLLILMPVSAFAQTLAAEGGVAKTVIAVSEGASEAELHAANELSHWLGEMSGAAIPILPSGSPLPANAIVVGQGALAKQAFPEVDWAALGPEDSLVRARGGRILLAGGRPRGTVYAVYRLLGRLGCRWWTPWAQTIPKRRRLVLPRTNLNEKPAFESRDSFWYPAFDGDWAARNGTNGQTARLEPKHGGKVVYAGFVHTFYPLVPPDPYFKLHPEWYSLIKGKRTAENAQLCTTDPALREFIVERVRQQLRAQPEATIVSVSQNDCFNPCQCDRCQALVKEQGTEAAPVLTLANYVAERIAKEFPKVAVDTLAYQYTRKAPKTLRPLPNVIVRLCSIECNFGAPLTDVSNASFANDIRDWSRLTNRLYIWNYDTNFAHYPQPIPNYFVLGPNERFFRANGVRGVFEQGAYQSNGGEMAEMRAWVQAQLLWNPNQNDRALIDEFLRGYYGPAAAKPIRQYLDLMASAAKGQTVTIYDAPNKAFFGFQTMLKAEALWQRAEQNASGDFLWRVKQGHQSVRWIWLERWNGYRAEARRMGVTWPLPMSRKAVADEWLRLAVGPGPAGWTPVSLVNEGGLTPQAWASRFETDPVEPDPLPHRPATAALPKDVDPMGRPVIDLQDNLARLANEPDWATLRVDPSASDGIACWMPGSHHEWAFQIPITEVAKAFVPGRWRVLIVARIESDATSGPAFSAGVYDPATLRVFGNREIDAKEVSAGYQTVDLGVISLTSSSLLWVAPPARNEIRGIWIDRILLVKEA